MNKEKIKRAEVLSPAGDMERFLAAVNFGADAVYLAGKNFGMRTSPSNFSKEDLKNAIDYAHLNGVKVYLTCNTLPRNNEIDHLPEFVETARDLGIDAFIVADVGTLALIKKLAPKTDVHVSTQAGVVNYLTAKTFHEMGAKRVVLARELSLSEITEIRQKTDENLELEAFVHGSMCVSFSGRCLLSSYLTGRDANRGDCAQPCRWKYNLVEENRQGQYFPVFEEADGTYFLNSRDLCMIEHIDKLVKAGVNSLKIEGRAKSAYYVAVTTNAYKMALLDYYSSTGNTGTAWQVKPWMKDELEKISHREYNTGFYFNSEPGQVYSNGGYIRNYDVVGVCEGYENGMLLVTQRNKFSIGDTLDVLEPGRAPFVLKVEKMYDEWNNEIVSAPHAMQRVYIPFEKAIKKGAFLRKRR